MLCWPDFNWWCGIDHEEHPKDQVNKVCKWRRRTTTLMVDIKEYLVSYCSTGTGKCLNVSMPLKILLEIYNCESHKNKEKRIILSFVNKMTTWKKRKRRSQKPKKEKKRKKVKFVFYRMLLRFISIEKASVLSGCRTHGQQNDAFMPNTFYILKEMNI